MGKWKKRGYSDPISAEQVKAIAELSEKGCSRPEIAKHCEVSKITVYKYQKILDLV